MLQAIDHDVPQAEKRHFWFLRRINTALAKTPRQGYEGRVFPPSDSAESDAKETEARLLSETFPVGVHIKLHDWGHLGWNVAVWWKIGLN